MAGPMIVAVWIAEADSAKAEGSDSTGTTPGSSAETVGLSKVRAAPMTATAAKMPWAPSQPWRLPSASARRRQGLDGLAGPHDGAAVVLVGGVARRDGQQQHGDELHEADEAELQRRAREREDLPAHHDGDDLEGGGRQRPGEPEAQEGGLAQEGRDVRRRDGLRGGGQDGGDPRDGGHPLVSPGGGSAPLKILFRRRPAP